MTLVTSLLTTNLKVGRQCGVISTSTHKINKHVFVLAELSDITETAPQTQTNKSEIDIKPEPADTSPGTN